MILHAQVFKGNVSVADFTPNISQADNEGTPARNHSEDC
jgi:hypothetical protein